MSNREDIERAVASLHTKHWEEWNAFRVAARKIERLISKALGAHQRGDAVACHAACKELLDAEHELYGDCHSEPLTALLGYVDPEEASGG